MDHWSGFVGLVVVLGIILIDWRLNKILIEVRKLTAKPEKPKEPNRE